MIGEGDNKPPLHMACVVDPGYAASTQMLAADSHAVGNWRMPARDRTPADILARMLLLSCVTTALPMPFVREWGVLAIFLWMAVGDRRLALRQDLLGVALVALATWAVAGAVSMAVRIDPSWILYEEVPCALQVLVVMCLVPRVNSIDLDDSLGRIAWAFLIGALSLSVLALLLFFTFRILGPWMDKVFALAGSNRVAHERASLRSDYNAFAVGVTALAAAGALLVVPRRWSLAAMVLVSALAVDLVSDSRRVLLLASCAVPLVSAARFGLGGSVLVLLGLVLVGVSASALITDLAWSDILSPRTVAFLQTDINSLDGMGDAITRDGMWKWGLSKVSEATIGEWSAGYGFQHMLEIGGIFTDPLEPNMTFGYVHNVLLGTMLSFGAVGLAVLLVVLLGVAGRIWRLRAGPSGQVLALLLASGLIVGFWSGNTVFSIPLLAVCLSVTLKVHYNDRPPSNRVRL